VPAAAKTTLTLWTSDAGAQALPIKKAADEFEKDFPNYQVNVVTVAGYNDKLVAAFAAGTPPDVFQINEYNAAQWAIRGFLEPLDPYITRSKFDIQNISKKVLAIHKLKGRIYGLPKDFSTLGLYYNKNILAVAGIPEPKKLTWNEVIAMGPKLSRFDSSGKQTQYAINTALSEVFTGAVVGGNSADLMNLDTDRFAGCLDSKPALEAIQMLADLLLKHKIAYVGDWNTGPFEQGKSALMIRGPWQIPAYRKSLTKFKWGTTLMPYFKAPATTLLEAGWAMGTTSRHKDASWKLLSYMGGYQGAKAMGETGYAIPAHSRAVRECNLDKDPYFAAFWDSADTAIPCYRALNPAFMDSWNKIIQPKFDQIMAGKLDVDKTVHDVVKIADDEMARLMKRYKWR
jgi:multiple sugar transport system substrate-binding protein